MCAITIAYCRRSTPTPEEYAGAGSEAVRWRNASRWRGETEPCDCVLSDRPDIRRAYEAAGVEALPLAADPTPAEDDQEGGSPLPDLPAGGAPLAVLVRRGSWYDLSDGSTVRRKDAEARGAVFPDNL